MGVVVLISLAWPTMRLDRHAQRPGDPTDQLGIASEAVLGKKRALKWLADRQMRRTLKG